VADKGSQNSASHAQTDAAPRHAEHRDPLALRARLFALGLVVAKTAAGIRSQCDSPSSSIDAVVQHSLCRSARSQIRSSAAQLPTYRAPPTPIDPQRVPPALAVKATDPRQSNQHSRNSALLGCVGDTPSQRSSCRRRNKHSVRPCRTVPGHCPCFDPPVCRINHGIDADLNLLGNLGNDTIHAAFDTECVRAHQVF
jgi:hypothetical protein